MCMSFPMPVKTYFSTGAGGGVRGTTAGIVHSTMTEDGLIIPIPLISTEAFLRIGGIVTEIIAGKGIGGNLSGLIIRTFNETGMCGRKTDTGKNKGMVCGK